ncbi:hypothetical protein [Blastococcus sp. PRF04-17]|uniref:hypothetical protein n=1 Tax=Blastococcus sp. PRF04-17 TaxID=2933797 RepID=UPI001FF4819B|nr:hypothetical protein [Blastococcus sp. PRF04-17]UOY01614.1 hypothetical protein MVA48_22285 [Blastococcus sp. PRF04-17]
MDADEPVTERFETELPEQRDRQGKPPVPQADDGPDTERFVVDVAEDDEPEDDGGPPTQRWIVDFSDGEPEPGARERTPAVAAPAGETGDTDPAQEFVARLRSAAAEFAEAAGAESAVVREAVPPARHRRARCRVVLRYADDTTTDLTFLGPAGSPARPSRHAFDRQIRRWFGSGQHRSERWVVADPEASEGVAVDVTAWVTAG